MKQLLELIRETMCHHNDIRTDQIKSMSHREDIRTDQTRINISIRLIQSNLLHEKRRKQFTVSSQITFEQI